MEGKSNLPNIKDNRVKVAILAMAQLGEVDQGAKNNISRASRAGRRQGFNERGSVMG